MISRCLAPAASIANVSLAIVTDLANVSRSPSGYMYIKKNVFGAAVSYQLVTDIFGSQTNYGMNPHKLSFKRIFE